MNKHLLSSLAITLGLVAFGAQAAEATQVPAPSGPKLTKAERAEAATQRRADLAAANKKGEVPKVAEGTQDKPMAAKSTSAERKAERARNRAELAKANKAGKLPVTTEAGTDVKK